MSLTYPRRLLVLAGVFGIGMVLVLARLFSLQIAEGEAWRQRAYTALRPDRVLDVPRGSVLDARGRVLATDGECFNLVVKLAAWQGRLYHCPRCDREVYYRPEAPASRRVCTRCRKGVEFTDARDLAPLAGRLGTTASGIQKRVDLLSHELEVDIMKSLKEIQDPRRTTYRNYFLRDLGWRSTLVERDVSYEVAREVELHRERNPAFRIETGRARRYPGGAEFVNVLGRVPGGAGVGSRLEGFLDPVLRGEPGYIWFDPEDPERVTRHDRPVPGADVTLTIDTADQRLALDALGGVRGAFVLVNSETGAVVALASAPTYEPEQYLETLQLWSADGVDRESSPLLERSYASSHVPGSIVKPFTAVAALMDGVTNLARIIHCERNLVLEGKRVPNSLRCHTVHGDLDLHGALTRSCNIYFETVLAEMLERQSYTRFLDVGERFGLGRATGLEMEPSAVERRSFDFEGATSLGDLIGAAIGQGKMLLSPAQVARAYAGIATGRLPVLHVVARVGHRETVPRHEELGVPAAVLEPIRQALLDVARPEGTAARFGLARWGISCKTGTAQRNLEKRLYHSWMSGYLPAQHGRPAVAFAIVVLDTHRSGGDECGPRLATFLERFYATQGRAD